MLTGLITLVDMRSYAVPIALDGKAVAHINGEEWPVGEVPLNTPEGLVVLPGPVANHRD